VSSFENWCDSHYIPATADRRAVWNAALKEAAKAADERAQREQTSDIALRFRALAHDIRAMQTTAGAAGGEGK
jgi:hypothetical protein